MTRSKLSRNLILILVLTVCWTLQRSAYYNVTTRNGRTPLLNLGRKEGTHIIMNIGSNVDPIIPRLTDDPCTVSIAFEPIVSHLIPKHPALHVIPAAVTGDDNGWAAMNIYNRKGASSSLSKASFEDYWNKHTELKIVPTIAFRKILESLRGYNIDFLLTDMQGHDFTAVSSVGDLLAEVGVKRIVTEVYKDKVYTYKGVQNDLCENWLPHMTKIGYVFEGLSKITTGLETLVEGYRNAQEIKETCKVSTAKMEELPKAGLNEYNALWRLKSEAASNNLGIYQYGTASDTGQKFSPEDYAKCLLKL
jgi:hypothetical protein